MPTIKDIARAVGVSHATVSNVLNHKGNVSAQKVKLVMDAAKAMGYRVNEAASSLRSGGALVLAVILPDVGSTVYDDLYRSLCQAAAENGYSVLLRLTDNVPAAEYRAIEDVLASRARCAVVVSSLADPLKRYELLLRAGVDLVFALRGAPPGCISAGFDMEAIARDIASRSFADGAVERIAPPRPRSKLPFSPTRCLQAWPSIAWRASPRSTRVRRFRSSPRRSRTSLSLPARRWRWPPTARAAFCKNTRVSTALRPSVCCRPRNIRPISSTTAVWADRKSVV